MANEIITKESVDCVSRMAKAFAASGMFGYKSEADAFALMTIAQANGLHPAKAAERYHIIQGRPAMKSEAMLSSFQESGGKIKWIKRSNTECVLHLEHPQGGELDVSWTIERAKSAGLTGKNTWQQFPAQMLSARCVSEGVRALFPACLCGMYTPEEVSDMTSENFPANEEPQPPKKSVNNAVEAEIVEDAPKAEVPKKNDSGEVTESSAESSEDRDRKAFVTSMAKLQKRLPGVYAETLGAQGYEKAEEVPADKRQLVYNVVYMAVKNNA